MQYALKLENVTKHFPTFTLDHLSFSLPQGSVMGFIGENGAGKSTTIKLILNLLHRNEGTISVFGMDNIAQESQIKARIGVVSEVTALPAAFTARNLQSIYRGVYRNWDDKQFEGFLRRFQLDDRKRIKDYSKGMRMKLAIICALSHGAELLLLDEPTAGLDPVVRDEMLDLFREFMEDERHSILLSSHITSDLEKIADYITFIHEGRLLLSRSIEDLHDTFGVLSAPTNTLRDLVEGAVFAVRTNQFGAEALVDRTRLPHGMQAPPATLEQIMLFMTKGESIS